MSRLSARSVCQEFFTAIEHLECLPDVKYRRLGPKTAEIWAVTKDPSNSDTDTIYDKQVEFNSRYRQYSLIFDHLSGYDQLPDKCETISNRKGH